MDEQVLREKIRRLLEEGQFPHRQPDRTWGSPGVDAPCAVCGTPIRRESGGRNRARTCDLSLVRAALFQLSYPPRLILAHYGVSQSRTLRKTFRTSSAAALG